MYFFQMPVLKVCSLNRQNKLAVPVTSYDIKTVLVAVSKRINIKGSRIVLEKDGTGIVDNETLNHYNTKEETTFMILQAGESWCAENVVCSKEVMDESRKENIPADCNNAATEPVQQENGSQATDDNPVNAETSQPNEQNAEVAIDSVLESKKIINWNDFKIPWITIDPNVLDDLRKKKKIDSKSVQKVVTRIVDEMRYFSKHIPKSAFTNVALQLRDAYPKSFEDVNRDGERCGDGYHTVLQKMTNYNNNENRPHMRKSLSNDLKIPLNKRRALANIKAGCKDWQPIEYDENSDIDSLENQRNVLSQFANFVLTDEATLKEVKEIFDTTYAYQRFFLNSIDSENSKVVNVVDTWPCLLHKPYIFWHFEKLTGHDVKEIENNMKADIQALLAYGAVKRFTEIDIDNCNEEQKFLEGIQIISKHFGDDLSNIILKHPVRTFSNISSISKTFFLIQHYINIAGKYRFRYFNCS